MKLQSFQAYTDDNLMDLFVSDPVYSIKKPSAEDQFAEKVGRQIYEENTRARLPVEQYSAYFFGNVIEDGMVVVEHTETLSMDEDHQQPDDMQAFYLEANRGQWAFGVFCWYDGTSLTVLHFAA